MIGSDETGRLSAVVRALSTAEKSLRLYPPTSPIPRQSIDAALDAFVDIFGTGQPVISFTLTRDGFASRGEELATGMGTPELVTEMREHGIAELSIVPGCDADQVLAFLQTMQLDPAHVREQGGISTALLAAGVERIRVVDVQLTVVETIGPAEDEDIDEFLRSLVQDPEKLSAWFAAASAGDPKAFEEGLMELVRVSGPSGFETMLQSLSIAFLNQHSEGKDALLDLALDPGPSRDLTGGMFRFLDSVDIAGSILGGDLGKNMLSLSNALTALPLEQVTAQVRAEVQAMLPGAGKSSKEAAFLEHMIEVREAPEPEPSLADSDRTYRAVVEASTLSEELIERARNAVAGSGNAISAAGVRTMMTLLGQQTDFELFMQSATSLAGMVPRLIEQGDLPLAAHVITELARRESTDSGPWPELSARLREALSVAVGPRSMAALLSAVTIDPSQADNARAILRFAGEAGASALVAEAISHKAEGIAQAEELLGRRVVDLLNKLAPQAQWFQLSGLVARLVAENDARSIQTIEALAKRPDEQSRREVVTGLAQAGGPVAERILPQALRDPSSEVAVTAARSLARSAMPGAGQMLAARLGEIDVDGADFALAREIVTGLARISDPIADEALAKLAGRRALIKRGHYAEVQDLVQQAIAARAKGASR